MTKVLMVISAADRWTLNDGTVHPSGYWAEEVAVPYRIFSEAGWNITVATPGGKAPTLDQLSLGISGGMPWKRRDVKRYLDNIKPGALPGAVNMGEVISWLNKRLPDDVPEDEKTRRIVALQAGKIVYDGPATGLNREKLVQIYGPEIEDAILDRIANGDAPAHCAANTQ